MKEKILRNWKAKLICLMLATALWYLIKNNEARSSDRFDLRRDRANEPSRLFPAATPQNELKPKKTLRN